MQGLINHITKAQADINNMSPSELDSRILSIKTSSAVSIENDIFMMLAFMTKDFIYETSYYMGRIRNYYSSHFSKSSEVKDFIKLLKEYKPDGQGNYWEVDWDKILDIGKKDSDNGGNGGGNDSGDGCFDCCFCVTEGIAEDMKSRGVSNGVANTVATIMNIGIIAAPIGLAAFIISALFDSDSCAHSCAESSCDSCADCGSNICDVIGNIITGCLCG